MLNLLEYTFRRLFVVNFDELVEGFGVSGLQHNNGLSDKMCKLRNSTTNRQTDRQTIAVSVIDVVNDDKCANVRKFTFISL